MNDLLPVNYNSNPFSKTQLKTRAETITYSSKLIKIDGNHKRDSFSFRCSITILENLLKIDSRISKEYSDHKIIGSGANGFVVSCKNLTDNQLYAIKILNLSGFYF